MRVGSFDVHLDCWLQDSGDGVINETWKRENDGNCRLHPIMCRSKPIIVLFPSLCDGASGLLLS